MIPGHFYLSIKTIHLSQSLCDSTRPSNHKGFRVVPLEAYPEWKDSFQVNLGYTFGPDN